MSGSLTKKLPIALCAGAIGLSMCAAPVALAANGVQPGTQKYVSENPGSWTGGDGNETGNIDLIYDTTKGTWNDGEADHPNGTYIVVIPTDISYENMKVGAVATEDIFDVVVKGVLAENNTIKLSTNASPFRGPTGVSSSVTSKASMNDTLTGNTAGEYTAESFRTFTPAQALGTVSGDNAQVSGTTVKDKIAMTGNVGVSGSWIGAMQYSSQLITTGGAE